MTLDELIRRARDQVNARIAVYNEHTRILNQLRAAESPDDAAINARSLERVGVEAEITQLRGQLERLEAEQRDDEAMTRLQSQITPTGQLAGSSEHEVAGDGGFRAAAEGRDGFGMPRRQSMFAAAQPGAFVRMADLQPAAVARGQRFANHPVVAREAAKFEARDQAIIGQHGSLGQLVRAMSTTSGSAIVPTVWAANVIDRARNLSAVLQAGAQIVPMDAKVVQIGRLTADPTAAFRAEGTAITASDPTFDNVTLTAKSLNALIVGSLEWFADAGNAEELVENAIAQAIALQLDKVALYGGTNTGGVDLTAVTNPTGIVANLTANASSSILGNATNGTTQTAASFYNELLDTVYTPRDYNESPGAVIWNSKLARMYAKAYDSTYQPLRRPADLDALQWFVSNQIPSYTQGTMTSVATDVFAGDFTQLLIGQRLELSIQILTERYADVGQIGIVATWRGDVGLARPRAFSVYKAIKGN